MVGKILKTLSRKNMLENTYVIITSDHGEGFWEHGQPEHGNSLYDELLRVPLIILPPGGKKTQPKRVGTPISNIDLAPTIYDIAGIKDMGDLDGRSLKRFYAGTRTLSQDEIISGSCHNECINSLAFYDGPIKYIYDPESDIMEIFDLEDDPGETENLAKNPNFTSVAQAIKDRLKHFMEENDKLRYNITTNEVEESVAQKLKAMGYIG